MQGLIFPWHMTTLCLVIPARLLLSGNPHPDRVGGRGAVYKHDCVLIVKGAQRACKPRPYYLLWVSIQTQQTPYVEQRGSVFYLQREWITDLDVAIHL